MPPAVHGPVVLGGGTTVLVGDEVVGFAFRGAFVFWQVMSNTVRGYCKICGTFGDLTYEHLPPRSAFNDKGILLHSFLYTDHPKHKIGKKKAEIMHRRGVGFYTLCGKCNSDTGGWYGADYLTWAQQAMSYIDIVERSQIIYVPFRIRPLNVINRSFRWACRVRLAVIEVIQNLHASF